MIAYMVNSSRASCSEMIPLVTTTHSDEYRILNETIHLTVRETWSPRLVANFSALRGSRLPIGRRRPCAAVRFAAVSAFLRQDVQCRKCNAREGHTCLGSSLDCDISETSENFPGCNQARCGKFTVLVIFYIRGIGTRDIG